MGEMESFAQTLLHSATCAHIQHWQTTSYAEHKALQKYYESMPDLVDDLVETYMGRNGLVGEFEPEFYIEQKRPPEGLRDTELGRWNHGSDQLNDLQT
jgi:hypothetical protein